MDQPTHRVERPPYRDVPEGDTLGLRHVRVALADIEWPLTTKTLRARVGHWRVPVTGAHYHRLDEMLAGMDEDEEWRSADDLARAIAKARPELRE